jgi:hypothetical protein
MDQPPSDRPRSDPLPPPSPEGLISGTPPSAPGIPPPATPAPITSEPQPATPAARPANGEIRFYAVAAAVGGFLAVVGVFLKWFTARVAFSGASVGGVNIPAINRSQSFNGTEDWTGVVCLIVGVLILLVGIAGILAQEPGQRKAMNTAAAVGGIIVIAMCVVALIRIDSAVGDAKSAIEDSLNASGGGLQGLLDKFTVEAAAAFGLYVSFLGGIVAVVGGFLGARQSEP